MSAIERPSEPVSRTSDAGAVCPLRTRHIAQGGGEGN